MKAECRFDYSKAKPNRFVATPQKGKRVYCESYIVTVQKADGTTEVREVTPLKDTVILEPEVRRYFPDSAAVNEALRGLIALVPQIPRKKVRA